MTSTSTFTLTFQNPGEIDIRGALITGLHAKADSSAIGFFGTGLKYAIACIVRWGGVITIYSGTEQHTFSSRLVDFRGQPAEIITHNGADTGFTTAYGKTWQPWMVIRELESNARDEGGAGTLGRLAPAVGLTTIVVKCDELRAAWLDLPTIMLPAEREPLCLLDDIEVLDQPSKHIYYKGVRVYNLPGQLTCNLRGDMALTEDRTLSNPYIVGSCLGAALQQLTNKAFLERYLPLTLEKGYARLEQQVIYSQYCPTTDEFLEVAQALYRKAPSKCDKLVDLLEAKRPDVLRPQPITLTPHQEHMLAKAKRLVATMGCGDPATIRLTIANLPAGQLGRYDATADEVLLSDELFAQGMRALVSTLFEEMLHRHTKKADLTYDMQTHLVNLIVGLYDEHVWHEGL